MSLTSAKNGEARQCGDTNRASMSVNFCEKTNMNIVAKSEYNFKGVDLVPVADVAGVWLTSSDIAKALGYASSKSVSTIYSRNSDEFTSSMSMVIKMKTNGINNNLREKSVRVFSLRGCHLIAMFATTDKAKSFRKWVLDVLDREAVESQIPSGFDFAIAAHNARAINSHLKAIKEMWRGGLEDALKLMEYKYRGCISERLADMTFHTIPLENSLNNFGNKGRIH